MNIAPVECPACKSNQIGAAQPIEDYEYCVDYRATYAACGNCGTLFQNPMPGSSQLAHFYPQNYHSQTNEGMLNRIRNQMRVRRLQQFLNGAGSVLDFGCGNGAFISFAADAMPQCSFLGYELNAVTSKRDLKERATIIEGQVDDLLSDDRTYNLVTMNHVIEHLPNPFDTISRLYGKLAPGAALEGQTPAAGSMEHRVFGRYWSGYHAPRHTVIFSSSGLKQLLLRAGFSSVEITPAINPAALAVSLAAVWKRNSRSKILRKGVSWLFWVGCGSMLLPFDIITTPGVINFVARKTDLESRV